MTNTRLVFAYDGSATATAAIVWMRERAAAPGAAPEIVTLTLDLGQRDELDAVRERALAAGAARAHVLDVRESFAHDYLLPALRAGAACDTDGRPLGRALSRPLIARQLVDVARMEGTSIVAHGAWRDAVDRRRLEQAIHLLAPDVEVRAPLVEWDASEDEIVAFAEGRGIRLPRIASRVATDIWGRCVQIDDRDENGAGSHAGSSASGPTFFAWTKSPDEAPEVPAFVDIEFARGVPVGISGVQMPLLEIISSLDTIAGAHGVGRSGRDPHDDRSLTARILRGSTEEPEGEESCEAPAATLLVKAHDALERAVLSHDAAAAHAQVRGWYRDLVLHGSWTGVAREACQAFIDRTQAGVTGSVRLTLSRGTCRVDDVAVRETRVPASAGTR